MQIGSNTLVLSYLSLRKAIGVLGMALPFVVSIGAKVIFSSGLQESISAYYYTGMRNVFVGTLCAIGIFLFSYQGYERQDYIGGRLACFFAVGIALFPTTPAPGASSLARFIGGLHLAFAAAFFLTLAYFSLCLFTKTGPGRPTRRKLQRNRVYRLCGIVMVICILLVAIGKLLSVQQEFINQYHTVFWLESIAIFAFGFSWLTKGEAILKDET